MSRQRLHHLLSTAELDHQLKRLYTNELPRQKARYLELLERGESVRAAGSSFFVSVPGRTELGGNHTDHNHGRVLAAAVNLDCLGYIIPVNEKTITIHSGSLSEKICIDLLELDAVTEETGTAAALVRGMAAQWARQHKLNRGFTAFIDSDCPVGAGLSSSAAFALLVGAALARISDGLLNPLELAEMAHHAENLFFGKPCGLMDQLSCSLGSVISIDFESPDHPKIERITVDFSQTGYRLVLVDSGSSHAELTADYAAIPQEMFQVAESLGKSCGREIQQEELLTHLPAIREKTGDRAILRMLHFLEENQRVYLQAQALCSGNMANFLQLVQQSGDSSWQLLQNCATGDPREQPIPLAIVLSKTLSPGCTARVHGGGFAGTIQVWVPEDEFTTFCKGIRQVFGPDSVIEIKTGRPGISLLTADGFSFLAEEHA